VYYGIYKKKRKKIPKSNEKQKKKKQITRIRKLYEGPFKPTCSTEVTVDDECYLTLDGNEWTESN
jgi:hypothetical protein